MTGHKTTVDGTEYAICAGKTLAEGTIWDIKDGVGRADGTDGEIPFSYYIEAGKYIVWIPDDVWGEYPEFGFYPVSAVYYGADEEWDVEHGLHGVISLELHNRAEWGLPPELAMECEGHPEGYFYFSGRDVEISIFEPIKVTKEEYDAFFYYATLIN